MKLSLALALFAAGAPVALAGAARAQTMDAPAASAAQTPMLAPIPMAPKSAATSDAFVWRFAPPVGSRWTMRSFTRTTSTTDAPAMNGQKAQQFKFIAIQKMTADYDIIKRDDLGATTIRMTLRSMTNDVTSMANGKAVDFPFPKKSNPNAVNGAQLLIKEAPDGKIWSVVGMRAFQRKMLEATGLLDKETIDQTLDALPTGDTALVKSMSMEAGTLPTSPVRVGESWTYQIAMPPMLPLTLDISGTRTLKTLDANNAVVSDSATMNGGNAKKNVPVLPGASNIRIDYSQLTGAINGITRVQRSSGLPLETTMNLTLKGNISTTAPATMDGAKAQTITVPMNVTTSQRVVLEPR